MTHGPTHLRNVLLSAAGRRVHLLRLLDESLAALGLGGHTIASDISPLSSAMQACGQREIVPAVNDANCLPALLELVARRSIGLIVPTIDTELMFYARHRDDFGAAGCGINISDPATIDIGNDKNKTFDFLRRLGIPTPRLWMLAEFRSNFDSRLLPAIAKPRAGSGSIGVCALRRAEEVAALTGDLVVQSLAPGREYTVDVYIDAAGRCRCAVPRLRLETRAGEVSKAVTVRNQTVADLARRVAVSLPGARGVLNVQIFHDDASDIANVIEINPRFGGGYPLSHQAGAPMTTWLLQEAMGLPCSASDDQWREGVVMLRYDDAIFTDAQTVGLQHLRRAHAPAPAAL